MKWFVYSDNLKQAMHSKPRRSLSVLNYVANSVIARIYDSIVWLSDLVMWRLDRSSIHFLAAWRKTGFSFIRFSFAYVSSFH